MGPTFSASVTTPSRNVSGAQRLSTRRAQRGMACEWQLLLGGEDAHAHALIALHFGGSALHEYRFRQVELARDRLHLFRCQVNRIHHHGKRIPLEGGLGEDIGDKVLERATGGWHIPIMRSQTGWGIWKSLPLAVLAAVLEDQSGTSNTKAALH